MKRFHTTLAVASGVVCCLLVIILPVSYHFNLSRFDDRSGKLLPNDCIAFASHIRLGFYNGAVWFYCYEIPYMGSIRSLGDEKGIIYKNGHARKVRDLYWVVGEFGIKQETLIGERGEFVEKARYCDLPGVYFRCFDGADYSPPDWTLRISLWYPVSLFAILPALWIYRRQRFRAKKP